MPTRISNAYQRIDHLIKNDQSVILDGGVTTELERVGMKDHHISDQGLWGTWALYHMPNVVKEVHRRYVADAQCDVISTNTWAILNALRSKLEPDGKIISSIPNIRTISFVSKLLFAKRFEYKESGVMDITHLRFFARKDIEIMFTDAVYSNIKIIALKPGRNAFKRLGRAIFGDLVLKRFLITATKS